MRSNCNECQAYIRCIDLCIVDFKFVYFISNRFQICGTFSKRNEQAGIDRFVPAHAYF